MKVSPVVYKKEELFRFEVAKKLEELKLDCKGTVYWVAKKNGERVGYSKEESSVRKEILEKTHVKDCELNKFLAAFGESSECEQQDEMPDGLECMLAGDLVDDSVISLDSGHTYGEKGIKKWIKSQEARQKKDTRITVSDPLTREVISEKRFVPNVPIREVSKVYRQSPAYLKGKKEEKNAEIELKILAITEELSSGKDARKKLLLLRDIEKLLLLRKDCYEEIGKKKEAEADDFLIIEVSHARFLFREGRNAERNGDLRKAGKYFHHCSVLISNIIVKFKTDKLDYLVRNTEKAAKRVNKEAEAYNRSSGVVSVDKRPAGNSFVKRFAGNRASASEQKLNAYFKLMTLKNNIANKARAVSQKELNTFFDLAATGMIISLSESKNSGRDRQENGRARFFGRGYEVRGSRVSDSSNSLPLVNPNPVADL